MKKRTLLIIGLILNFGLAFGQIHKFDKISFIIGEWNGTGSGYSNEKSKIESSFQFIMDGRFIEVKNESKFEPTERNPIGEIHIDKGFISFDESRNAIVYRQFNNEGYVNQYILNDSLSTNTIIIFETEFIENFVPGGKARWTIKKKSGTTIETIFDVSFPNEKYSCFGINNLKKK